MKPIPCVHSWFRQPNGLFRCTHCHAWFRPRRETPPLTAYWRRVLVLIGALALVSFGVGLYLAFCP